MASLSYPHPAAVEVAKDPLIGCQAGPEGVDVDGDLPAPSIIISAHRFTFANSSHTENTQKDFF
jgi:hypothetical protein